MKNKENPLFSLLLTIVIPSFLLEKLSGWIDYDNAALISLIVALSFPIGYGIWDYVSKKNKSWMAILGVINISLSGGFALLQLSGQWFTLKEAAFPFLIGVFVWMSSTKEKNFFQLIMINPQFLKIDLLNKKIQETGTGKKLASLFVRSNKLFAVSFFLSALLNFILAYKIFIPIQETDTNKIQNILNSQVAQMNWMGFVVIAMPLMVFSLYIFMDFFKKLKSFSGLGFKEILNVDKTI
ncbi:MAG: hypothetical protein HAW60_03105 [Bdellovibrionales bacterium]|nr:hypothetical protein [Bdellovibrionales bacterium]